MEVVVDVVDDGVLDEAELPAVGVRGVHVSDHEADIDVVVHPEAVALRGPQNTHHDNVQLGESGLATTRSTQPCILPGSLNRVPASAGVRAGMSPLPGGR